MFCFTLYGLERKCFMPGKPEGHSKEDALESEEWALIVMNGPERDASGRADPHDEVLLVLTGQLGLRAEEAGHCHKDWLSIQQDKLKVPASWPCTIGEKGKSCADCAKEGGLFHPKTKNGARTIPYKDLTGAREILHSFFRQHGQVGLSRITVWRRVKAMSERARILKRGYPHALRATAGMQFATMGLAAVELMSVMGWGDIRVANDYIKASGVNVEKAIAQAKLEGRHWL